MPDPRASGLSAPGSAGGAPVEASRGSAGNAGNAPRASTALREGDPLPDVQYRFGEFKLLPAERLLFRHGAAVALTARAFRLLVALVAHGGRLLSKDELMRRVWPGVVVEENNLAVQIAALRKVLGSRAIVTIAGCGYRFALPVAEVADPAAPGGVRAGNLPVRLPPLIGRVEELAELTRLHAEAPLVTLCGEAGVGKTRLAQAMATAVRDRHPDGVWWVDLAALPPRSDVTAAVARTLGLSLGEDPAKGAAPAATHGAANGEAHGDAATPRNGTTLGALIARLAPAALLLVLDNAEHLVDEAGPVVEALVRATPRVTVLVTSQLPLRVDGERLMRLAPLPVEDAMSLLAERAGLSPRDEGAAERASLGDRGDAVAERAGSRDWEDAVAGRAGSRDWDDAAAERICRRLDGNPLAIQLAAARVHALGLDGLEARLPQRLTLLAPGDPQRATRRNALAAALAWSCDLLSERERLVLRRLGVFPASFSLEGAALVLADDLLPAARVIETVLALDDRSLVSVEPVTPRRLRLLETMRIFAREQMDAAGEAEAMRARWCRGLRWLFDEAYGEHWRLPQAAWRARYEPELVALWPALETALDLAPMEAVALFASSWPAWVLGEAQDRARAIAPKLVALVDEHPEPAVRARFWEAMARGHAVDHPATARDAATRAAALYRELGDRRGEYLALVELAFNWRVDGDVAREALDRARALEEADWPAAVLERGWSTEATLSTSGGDPDGARRAFEAAVAVSRRDGHDTGIDRGLANLADLARVDGRVDDAIREGEALRARMARAAPTALNAVVLTNLIGALLERGDAARAREVADECARRLGPLLFDTCVWTALDTLGRLHLSEGAIETAARLAGASDRAFREHGQARRQPNEARDRAVIDATLADLDPARRAVLLEEGGRLDEIAALRLAFGLTPGLTRPQGPAGT
ncbi:MAG: helix-turn-helix transcriptional regulator [Mitsuaria chitosanitabida]|uniref:ATP-binding protein n=1 Tax=Roseateles chitosanitabidus TaxID=65048 RepID=UPI001B1669A9|nr:winged helix-turn-helix domain-containing protein [Roseateles chitosanitabidus]MBO9688483.1 helix-turn-helix transcriptional regulator [Roseateles chitosanitabidus]